MDTLVLLKYGGLGALLLLLVLFEIRDLRFGAAGGKQSGASYQYFTPDGSCVLVRKALLGYKVYVSNSPIPTMRDRYGDYIKIYARSAEEAEFKIDQMFGGDLS